MLFSEIYGAYFDAVGAILAEAADGTLTKKRISEIVRERCFAESGMVIPKNLTDGTWPLLTKELTTPIRREIARPMTLNEKRWLKALLADPRIRLFDADDTGLKDVEPLFRPDQFVRFDVYADGDPYTDEGYIRRFRLLLNAIREHRHAEVTFDSQKSRHFVWTVLPVELEYSQADDKFRLICADERGCRREINLRRITNVRVFAGFEPGHVQLRSARSETLVFELTDERNALERAMVQFSYLGKETERIGEDRYRVTLTYRQSDETEILIKLLSFGPCIRVTAPERFIALMRERILNQMEIAH